MFNPFSAIVAYFKVRSTVAEIEKEATLPTVSGKPGWKTTEFWLSLGAQIALIWGAVKGFVPAQTAAIVSIIGTSIYTIAATVRKAVADVQAAKTTP